MAIRGLSESGSAAYLPDSAVLLRTRVTVRGPIAAGEPTRRALEDDDLSINPDRDCLAQTNEDVDPGQDYDKLAALVRAHLDMDHIRRAMGLPA